MTATTVEPALMHDFGGWATKADLVCSDGLTIGSGAFAHQDGKKVPLVWSHKHDDPENVLGHSILRSRDGHMYAENYFNKTPKGIATKLIVEHGDLDSLSIWANALKKVGKKVVHGMIREVSLVLAGANPEAKIDFVNLRHSDGYLDDDFDDEDAIITMGLKIEHTGMADAPEKKEDNVEHAEGTKSAQEVLDSMTEEQKEFLFQSITLAGLKAEQVEQSATGGDDDTDHSGKVGDNDTTLAHQEGRTGDMTSTTDTTHRIFDGGADDGALSHDGFNDESNILVHSLFDPNGPVRHQTGLPNNHLTHISNDALKTLVRRAQRSRASLRDIVVAHAEGTDQIRHGIENLEVMFPDAKAIDDMPQLLKRRTEWVNGVLTGVSRRPFSRIKTVYADLTEEEARARGHLKGNLKVEEFFRLAKRVTTPTMVYKKQKLDREDVLEITEYNVIVFMKGEMRLMLDEELARAIFIGDGRPSDDDDKIKDPGGDVAEGAGIRSIYNDHEIYAPKVNVNLQDAVTRGEGADKILAGIGEHYKGSGSPKFYGTLQVINKMLLERDADGRRLYKNRAELAAEMGVSEVVEVEVFNSVPGLVGIVVNLKDYVVGTNAGGEVTMFDDFDIDYNAMKYLIETFLSGALNVLKSAVVFIDAGVANPAAALVVPTEPTFDAETGELTITDTTGVVYTHVGVGVINNAGSPYLLDPGESWTVKATPASNAYYLEDNVDDEWTFTADA